MNERETSTLRRLARALGILTEYTDVLRRKRRASPDVLLALSAGLGFPLGRIGEARDALRELRKRRWQEVLPPVTVLWLEGEERAPESFVSLRLPHSECRGTLECRLVLEGRRTRRWTVVAGRLGTARTAQVEGTPYVEKRLPLPSDVPLGYHTLTVELRGVRAETRLLAAPRLAYGAEEELREWGIFAPLHALRSRRSWGAGSYGDAAELAQWVGLAGGSVVSTLPLLPAFLDRDPVVSPYSPVSRLFWNELFIDMEDVPEVESSSGGKGVPGGRSLERKLRALRSKELVDYAGVMAVKRPILELAAERIFRGRSRRRGELREFVAKHPNVEEYARFRAASETHGRDWRKWADRDDPRSSGGVVADERVFRYYLYAQWIAEEQMGRLSEVADTAGVGLYLDLPLGAHPDGYDVWRHREAFAEGATGGAPPDPVFTEGQDWGFPPLHPHRLRESRYEYFIAVIRHHMRHARWLRLDHVMALHRLYWVPAGFAARDGAYVRYPEDELYAILSIESHRNRCLVVGENLGTVPPAVNREMARHGIRRMYVVEYELRPEASRPLRPVPEGVVASANTHDMVPWRGHWEGVDIADRLDLELMTRAESRKELRVRSRLLKRLRQFLAKDGRLQASPEELESLLRACLRYLGRSRAGLVMVNLEDLWLARDPQNVPGTDKERPNWRRKAELSQEEILRHPRFADILRALDASRREA